MMHSKNEQIDALDELFKTPAREFSRWPICDSHSQPTVIAQRCAGRRCSLRDVDQSQTQEEARGSRLTVCVVVLCCGWRVLCVCSWWYCNRSLWARTCVTIATALAAPVCSSSAVLARRVCGMSVAQRGKRRALRRVRVEVSLAMCAASLTTPRSHTGMGDNRGHALHAGHQDARCGGLARR